MTQFLIKEFLESIKEKKLFSLSVIGNVKNAGKTVTLNFLIHHLQNELLGVTSIGLDGERFDTVTYTPKPSITLPAGSIVATAAQTLKNFRCGYEILKGTGIFNPLGEILYVKLKQNGEALVAGPERSTDLKKVIDGFREFNCTKALVDGAIDRKMAAAPTVTDATIFVVGASYSRDINRLVKDTIHQINILSLPKISMDLIKAAWGLLEQSNIALISSQGLKILPFKSSLMVNEISKYMEKNDDNNLYISGALLDSFTKEIIQMLKKGYRVRLIVKDGTKVFISWETYTELLAQGGTIEVIADCKVLAIAVNPVSVEGYEFSSEKLVENIRRFTCIPVFDPLY